MSVRPNDLSRRAFLFIKIDWIDMFSSIYLYKLPSITFFVSCMNGLCYGRGLSAGWDGNPLTHRHSGIVIIDAVILLMQLLTSLLDLLRDK